MKTKSVIIEIVCCLYILLFVYTAVSKFLTMDVFYAQMEHLPFDDRLTPLIAYGTPTAEVVLSIMLAIPAWRMKGLYGAVGLMSVFTIYVGLILSHFFGKEYPCSCGGVMRELGWVEHMYFNSFFIVIGIVAILFLRSIHKTNPPAPLNISGTTVPHPNA